ncbi:MAG TPA: glycosyl hydrolase family 39 [Acidobacteriaceae bacterium]|jgi:xylan 1,4-beta-xylosidase|nr:glycosyl hydrolase family 39 [Acidobacteriaceae bacterium]
MRSLSGAFPLVVLLCLFQGAVDGQSRANESIVVNATAPTTPFPHFWEQTFGSGHAILSLREDYRDNLRTVKQATDFQSIRFHGIFDDEVGLYDPDRMTRNPGLAAQKADDASAYNFSYVDQIYDGLLANHVRPFIELSFMPRKMAADPNQTQAFWYRPVVSPPKSYDDWDAMIRVFAQHLIARYGIDKVATWKFEVWNEPNLDFWGGRPNQPTYFELYDHTARALKSVSPRLQVGGPATAQAAWVTPFLEHAKQDNVPVDFVSTHVYANDTAHNVFGTEEQIPRAQMVFRAVKKVHEEIEHSPFPHLPLIFSEYNASYSNEPNVTDSDFIGPWLANTIRECDGLISNMAYWDFSDVFEEQGIVRSPFYGGFGLIAADEIPKPSLNVFRALHKLGTARLALNSDSALATTSSDGHLALALWNYAPPYGTGPHYTMPPAALPPSKTFTVTLQHVPANAAVEIWRVDDDHGNVLKAFNAMGRPPGDLTQQQIAGLRAAGAMAAPEHMHLRHGQLEITVPPHGLAVILINR